MESKPNILLIFPDMWRGDCISAAGHPDVQTPYTDALIEQGVWFDGAYTSAPTCIPARACLATGLTADHCGRSGYQDRVEWRYPDTMMHQLRDNGYQTMQVGKTHFYPQRAQLGFEESRLYEIPVHHAAFESDYHAWLKEQTDGHIQDVARERNPNSVLVNPWKYDEYLHITNWTTTNAINMIERRDVTRPFFLQIGYHRPHVPYDAPMEFWERYRDKDVREPATGDWSERFNQRTNAIYKLRGQIDPRLSKDQLRGYYANIAHVDSEIGKLMWWLEKHDYLKNTWIFLLSDHGDMLGDHHMQGKANPFEGSTRIPFVVVPPKGSGNAVRKICHDPVTLYDVMPTVLELAGITSRCAMDGTSLVPILSGRDMPLREHLHGEHANPGQGNGWQYIVNQYEKYAWETLSGEEYYFDLVKDPRESHNAIHDPQYADRVALLRGKLIAELSTRPEDGFVRDGQLCPGKILPAVRHWVLDGAKIYP